MKRFLAVIAIAFPAVGLLDGCGGKKSHMNVAEVRVERGDTDAAMKRALLEMAVFRIEMAPGNRYLLVDYSGRTTNNYRGFMVCGDALAKQGDVHGAALSYWAAANYMRRIPFSPVETGQNMRAAYEKLNTLYQRNNMPSSGQLAEANRAQADAYLNSPVVANLQAAYDAAWDREQRLIAARDAAKVKLIAADAVLAAALINALTNSRDAGAQQALRHAQQQQRAAQDEYNRAEAALDAVKLPAAPETFSLIGQGNYPATMSMQFFANILPNPAGNANAMLTNFAQLEQQAHAAEAGK
jgi:hypothetical protein